MHSHKNTEAVDGAGEASGVASHQVNTALFQEEHARKMSSESEMSVEGESDGANSKRRDSKTGLSEVTVR